MNVKWVQNGNIKEPWTRENYFYRFFLSNVPKWTFVVQIASVRSSFQDMKVIALSGFIATSIPDIKVFYLCFPNIIFIFTGFLFFMEKIKIMLNCRCVQFGMHRISLTRCHFMSVMSHWVPKPILSSLIKQIIHSWLSSETRTFQSLPKLGNS